MPRIFQNNLMLHLIAAQYVWTEAGAKAGSGAEGAVWKLGVDQHADPKL